MLELIKLIFDDPITFVLDLIGAISLLGVMAGIYMLGVCFAGFNFIH